MRPLTSLNTIKLTLSIFLCIVCFIQSSLIADDTNNNFKIGVILPLTGDLAGIGTALKNGIRIAQQENLECFSNITMYWEDDQFIVNKSISALRKLQYIEKIDLLFLFGLPALKTLAPVLETNQLPTIAFTFISKPTLNKKFIITSLNDSPDYIKALVSNLRSRGIKNFSFIRSSNEFFEDMVETFKSQLNKDETIDFDETVDLKETDFRTIITKLKSKKITSLGIFLTHSQIVAFSKQLKEQNISTEIFGTDIFETAIAELNSGELENAVYPDNEVNKDFETKYLKEYANIDHLTFAANGYDMANLVSSQICSKNNDTKNFSSIEILNQITSQDNQSGALGKHKFINDLSGRHFIYPVITKKVIGKGWVKAE